MGTGQDLKTGDQQEFRVEAWEGSRLNNSTGPSRNLNALVAPLFVSRTHNGALISKLREMERGLSRLWSKVAPRL